MAIRNVVCQDDELDYARKDEWFGDDDVVNAFGTSQIDKRFDQRKKGASRK